MSDQDTSTSPSIGAIHVFDIGDSFMRSGFFANDSTVQVSTIPTPRAGKGLSGQAALLKAITEMEAALAELAPDPVALAVSTSGIMTLRPSPGARLLGPFKDSELYVMAANVDGLKYVPLLSLIEDLDFGVPVHVENKVNAAVRFITSKSDVICVSLGEGLAAAAKRNGHIERVMGTWSCHEIGHGMRWSFPEELLRRCRCGTTGCLEAVIGGWAMRERYRARPEEASTDVYAQMRSDVLTYLSPAIATLVRNTGLSQVVLAGAGGVGYFEDETALQELHSLVEQSLGNTRNVTIKTMSLDSIAGLEGVARAAIDCGIVPVVADHVSN